MILVGGMVAALLALAYGGYRGVRCNYRQFRHARGAEPLDGMSLRDFTVTPVPTPESWPDVDTVTEPGRAAAYASLADDRLLTWSLTGELLLVVGGALLGTQIQHIVSGEWQPVVLGLVAFGIGVAGLARRTRATRQWGPLAARYRARYAVLTAQPVPPPEPPRPAGLLGLFRRR